ncbi:Protein hedgehog [Armadillidium nasatum]|uniref:Protein hedgehog n=1 Tax=Armadillidium nasatum TaxID=96803 RepID=A0A5N5TH68_9CRUS|nr:Protein hedgehog [Armadillidium nasatum]
MKESKSRTKLTGCFPGEAIVDTPEGPLPLALLKIGDKVKVLRSDGMLTFSPVLMFLHEDPTHQRNFLSISTSSGMVLNLTPSHLLFTLRSYRAPSNPVFRESFSVGEVVLAGSVNLGDYLFVTQNDSSVRLDKIVDINSIFRKGVYAPLTAEGTVIVNNVVASCYAVIDSQYLAHWAFMPIKK